MSDTTLLTEGWLRSVGFVDYQAFGLGLKHSKDYGEDTATFWLAVYSFPDADDCFWELSHESIEAERESAMLPCNPCTRGSLRRLCAALGMPLVESR